MKFEFSAGGIVFKKEDDKIWVLLCQHSQHHGWVFPKGLIGDKVENESKEETAIREVKEETGAVGKIIDSLSPTSYWYIWNKEKIKKTVYFFLMEYISGDITEHDTEMENVEWLPIDKVEERLSYESDKEVFRQARLAHLFRYL
jgi:8-oxo-dGTP pyrophosphatase MutT (NUDIX family)